MTNLHFLYSVIFLVLPLKIQERNTAILNNQDNDFSNSKTAFQKCQILLCFDLAALQILGPVAFGSRIPGRSVLINGQVGRQ